MGNQQGSLFPLGTSVSRRRKAGGIAASGDECQPEFVWVESSALECPVCYSGYGRAPLVLRCGHSLCQRCFKQLWREVATMVRQRRQPTHQVECPLCRSLTTYPSAQFSIKPVVNHALDECIDAARAAHSNPKCQLGQPASSDVTDVDGLGALNVSLRIDNRELQHELTECREQKSKLVAERDELQQKLDTLKRMATLLFGGLVCLFWWWTNLPRAKPLR